MSSKVIKLACMQIINRGLNIGASEREKETDRNLSDVVAVKAMQLPGVAVNEEEPAETVLAKVVGEAEQGDGGEAGLKRDDRHLEALNLVPVALRTVAHGQRQQRRHHSHRREDAPRNHEAQRRVLVEP